MDDKRIVIEANGQIVILGKWKIGELMAGAQALINSVNNMEIETQPAPKPENSPVVD